MNVNYFKLLTAFCMQLFFLSMYSQVTIGSGEAPEAGALLQLKQKEFDGTGSSANSNKGLLMPRVSLISRLSLYPALTPAQENATGAKEKHTGLTVFNINTQPSSDPNLALEEGIYVWDGTKWSPTGGSSDCQTTEASYILPFFASSYNIETSNISKTATVSSNVNWTAVVTNDPNNLIILNTTSGSSGDTNFQFTIKGNSPVADINATATITFTSVGITPQVTKSVTFSLVQQKPIETPYIVPLFASSYYINTTPTSTTATVSSNVAWTAAVTNNPNNLITLNTTSGAAGDTNFLFTINGNSPATDITTAATITFTSVGVTPPITKAVTFNLNQVAGGVYFPELNVIFGGNGSGGQDAAFTYCANLAPVGTWRVPTQFELAGAFAIIKMNNNASVEDYGFKNKNLYWTSNIYNSGSGRVVTFADGVTSSDYTAGNQAVYPKNTPYRIICAKPIN